MDKAKIAAEGSPRELIEKYSTREVVELRFPIDARPNLDGRLDGVAERIEVLADARPLLDGGLAGAAERIEVLADRVLVYTSDGDAAVAAVHQSGLRPESSL